MSPSGTDTASLPSYRLRTGLVMTDYWFVAVLWLVVYVAIDPFGWHVDMRSFFKHVPAVLFVPCFALVVAGGALFRRPRRSVQVADLVRQQWHVFLFAIYVLAGSLVAKYALSIDNSFLTMGLYALMAPATTWFVLQSNAPLTLVRAIAFVYAFWAIVASGVQLYHFDGTHVFHAREHLVIPVVLIAYYGVRSKLLRAILMVFMFAVCFAVRKNTAYIAGILTLAIPYFIDHAHDLRRTTDLLDKAVRKVLVWLVLAFFGVALLLVFQYRSVLLPSGNADYRLYTYEKAITKFMSSPVWGTGFTGSATEKFDKFDVASVTQVLPTHSDPLDIAANGGLIALVAWILIFVAILKIWKNAVHEGSADPDKPMMALIHVFGAIVLNGLFVSLFNPIMNLPNLAWAWWTAIGVIFSLDVLRRAGVSFSNIRGGSVPESARRKEPYPLSVAARHSAVGS